MHENPSILTKTIPEPHISISQFPFTTKLLRKEVALLYSLYHLPVFILSWICTSKAFIPIVPLKLLFKITTGLHLIQPVSIVWHLPSDTHLVVALSQSFLAVHPYLPGFSMQKCHKIRPSCGTATHPLDDFIDSIKLHLIYSFMCLRFYVLQNFYLQPWSLFLNSKLVSSSSVPTLECPLDISNC